MALEAVIFSQDPLISYYYNNSCKDYANYWSYDYANNYNFSNTCPSEIIATIQNSSSNYNEINPWVDHHQQQQQQYDVSSNYSSPEGHCTVEQYLSGETAPPVTEVPPTGAAAAAGGGGRRKRRRRSCKNKEEVEHQRMTHIAVERNRRKLMNEYLAVIRSLMPASYAQRGDQASIVGGAINYVKELEQLLQSLEALKRTKLPHQEEQQSSQQSPTGDISNNTDELGNPEIGGTPLFENFFSFPQYSNRSSSQQLGSGSNSVTSNSGVGEIEVNMVDSHANVKMLTKKQPKQLLRLVAGFQGLRLSILHLNVTAVDPLVLYSFSLKVEEGSQLNSVDDIAAAANHILGQIQEEASSLLS